MSVIFARFAKTLAVCVVLVSGLLGALATSHAQDRRQNEPGQFDYYVLVLSWSPSFCAANAERSPARAAHDPQCGTRPFSFVVHGLWPQYERGFPEFCQMPPPRLNRGIVSSMLDLMPAPGLIFHEWDRHGTCAGVSPSAYFENIRRARAAVKIPAEFLDIQSVKTVTPDEVQEAFVKANPGLARDGMSISCGSRRLDEVRICMTRDFQFRDCAENARRSCRRDKLVMPPVRGG
jgi:ribonuclease T2